MRLWLLLALSGVAWGKTTQSTSCVRDAKDQPVCVIADANYNRRDNTIYFTFNNPTEESARFCTVDFLLMEDQGRGRFIRSGTAHVSTTLPIRPHDSFRMQARPTAYWDYIDTLVLTCDGAPTDLKLAYPLFLDGATEQSLKKKLGY